MKTVASTTPVFETRRYLEVANTAHAKLVSLRHIENRPCGCRCIVYSCTIRRSHGRQRVRDPWPSDLALAACYSSDIFDVWIDSSMSTMEHTRNCNVGIRDESPLAISLSLLIGLSSASPPRLILAASASASTLLPCLRSFLRLQRRDFTNGVTKSGSRGTSVTVFVGMQVSIK